MRRKKISRHQLFSLMQQHGKIEDARGFVSVISCPFCNRDYFPGEHRPNDCPYCEGNADRAQALTDTLTSFFADFEHYTRDEIVTVTQSAGGYYEFEAHRRLRAIDKQNESR